MKTYFLQVLVFLAILILDNGLFAQDSGADKIGEQLAAAVNAFGETRTDIREELIAAIDKALKRAETNKKMSIERRIEMVEGLRGARKAFIDNDVIPEIKSLRATTRNFKRKLSRAKSECVAAYQKAAKQYGDAGDLESAKNVLAELKEFQSEDRTKPEFGPFENPDLWVGKTTENLKNSDEIQSLKKQLASIKYNGQVLVYQHDGRAGRQYHCLITKGAVVRHNEGTSQWHVKNSEFYFTTRVGDKSWITRWNFNPDQTRFEAINQNSVTSKGVLVYGDPKAFFAEELDR